MNDHRVYYHRHLPHYHPPTATLFVTFRLMGTLPSHVVDRLRQERREIRKNITTVGNPKIKRELWRESQEQTFEKYGDLLDGLSYGPRWLEKEPIADLVMDAIRYRDGVEYDLLCCCVMPNHVHLLAKMDRDGLSLSKPFVRMIQSLKRYTAREANKLLGRTGPFWHGESYDHVVRDNQALQKIFWYILRNPVKAGLVRNWDEWKWTYYDRKSGLPSL